MPPIEVCDLHQTAVLWEHVGYDDANEITVSNAPYEVPVRWENQKTEAPGPDGEPIALDAMVVVDETIPTQSLMWLGELADLPTDGSGPGIYQGGLYQVMTVGSIPDIKGEVYRRVLGLVKYRDELPTLVTPS